jgi:hypothetical protein
MRVEQLPSRDVIALRRMREKGIALHGSVCDALDMAEEQIALSLKTISRSQTLVEKKKH